MDNHEVCRARILKLEAELKAAQTEAAEKDAKKNALIESLRAELMRYRADREFVA